MSQPNPGRIKTSYFPIANPLDRDKQNNEKKNWGKTKNDKKNKEEKNSQKEEREVEAVQIPARQRPMTPQSTTASPYGIAQTEYCLSKLDRFTKNGIKTKSWEKLR